MFNRARKGLVVFSLVLISVGGAGCLEGLEGDEDGDGIAGDPGDGANSGSYWQRNDGSLAWLSLGSGVAKACANGQETIGTYNGSAPSMTFVIGSDTLVFPLRFDGTDTLLVGVPQQGVDTNTATYYVRTSTYPCTAGTVGSAGSDSGTPAVGTFNIRIHNPTGACASTSGYHRAFVGSIYKTVWNNGTSAMGNVFANQNWPTGTTSTTAAWDYTATSTSKIQWEIYPDASSFPTYCIQRGEATIDSNGQTKSIDISFPQ
jgi:hypothetical protein